MLFLPSTIVAFWRSTRRSATWSLARLTNCVALTRLMTRRAPIWFHGGLNQIEVNGWTPNCLRINVCSPVTRLQNLDALNGLCNVNRLVVHGFWHIWRTLSSKWSSRWTRVLDLTNYVDTRAVRPSILYLMKAVVRALAYAMTLTKLKTRSCRESAYVLQKMCFHGKCTMPFCVRWNLRTCRYC